MLTEKTREAFERLKACVIVPTYNNEQTLSSVLTDLLRYTNNIIVVNDGSTDTTYNILQSFNNIEVTGYPVNKGKGYALRYGFKKALEKGYHYAITIDSDGQHFPEDLYKFLDQIEGNPGSLIMGARNMNQSGIPGRSSFGNNFSNFWFKFETGITLSDTQSGYRLYPLLLLKDLHFITRKFEFEIEVLVRAAWADIPIHQVPVKVFYAEKSKRVSHFRPFRDFTRISILNTILVTITLLYIKPRNLFRSIREGRFISHVRKVIWEKEESETKKSLAVGLGVFMGIAPVWGFQMLIALGLAFLLKLNKPLVILAANISIPPMIPFILYASHQMGAIYMGSKAVTISFDQEITYELVMSSMFQYVSGAITLALVAGLSFGLITFAILKLRRR
jgi:glycosyltransferase involved in cell wall biosynthesis